MGDKRVECFVGGVGDLYDELALELRFDLIDDLIDRVPNSEDNHVIFYAFLIAAKLYAGVRRCNPTEMIGERGRTLLISANEGELTTTFYETGADASTHVAGADTYNVL